MTRIDIGGVGYTRASELLGDANRWAASSVGTLSSALARGGAMAGDSSFAGEFAASYDEAAGGVVAGFDDLVGGLGGLCRLAHGSIENHWRAEQASVASTVVVTTEASLTGDHLHVTVSPVPPPSLGGDASFLPGWANAILDHVEGFVWPDADVDRLRDTATAWRSAAERLDEVEDMTTGAVYELCGERSPEVPLAVDALRDLREAVSDLATACRQLAVACDDYATAVETQRGLILDLVSDLIRDAVLIAAAGFVLGLVTGGTGNVVAAWVNAGKLGVHAPRFRAFVEALRLHAAGAAVGLRTTSSAVVNVQVRLSRFTHVAVIRTSSHSAVVDAGALARVRALMGDPKRFDPEFLRGTSSRSIREILDHWELAPSRKGAGYVLRDPIVKGRRIRVMNGYTKGNRPAELTHGPYAVVSQNGKRYKVPLEGNPVL